MGIHHDSIRSGSALAEARLAFIRATLFDGFLAARRRLRKGQADEITERIAAHLDAIGAATTPHADLIAANMRMLLPALGCVVPAAAREREAFVMRGGGWTLS